MDEIFPAGTMVDCVVFFQGEFLCQAVLKRLKDSKVPLPNFHYMCTFCGKEWATLMRLEEKPKHSFIQRRCPSCEPDHEFSGVISPPLVHLEIVSQEVLERDFLYLCELLEAGSLFYITQPE